MEKDFYYYHWMMKGSYNKSLFPREMFDLVEDIEFENTKLMCCKDAHKYLTQTYGDYMILPSEEQRLEAIPLKSSIQKKTIQNIYKKEK